MTKFKSIFKMSVVATMLFLLTSSCKKEQDFVGNSYKSSENSESLNDNERQYRIGKPIIMRPESIFIKITGSLHRGDKWSASHNVTPCTQSFGICGVGISGGIDLSFIKPTFTGNPNGNNNGRMKIVFEQCVPWAEPIFFSKEDDKFEVPTFIANDLDLESLTILPGDYAFKTTDDPATGEDESTTCPMGYVIVDVKAKELKNKNK